jgi:hypothetical protein
MATGRDAVTRGVDMGVEGKQTRECGFCLWEVLLVFFSFPDGNGWPLYTSSVSKSYVVSQLLLVLLFIVHQFVEVFARISFLIWSLALPCWDLLPHSQ